MRTQQEILDKLKEVQRTGFFGFQSSDLLTYLDYTFAKEFLKDQTTQAEWDAVKVSAAHDAILAEMKKYMEFAWDKANNCRGISAMRSLQHYEIWTWMLGDQEKFTFAGYQYYGKDILKAICEHYGWPDEAKRDDGRRVNSDAE